MHLLCHALERGCWKPGAGSFRHTRIHDFSLWLHSQRHTPVPRQRRGPCALFNNICLVARREQDVLLSKRREFYQMIAECPSLWGRFINTTHGWIAGSYSKILRTIDGGATWRNLQWSAQGLSVEWFDVAVRALLVVAIFLRARVEIASQLTQHDKLRA